MLEWVSTHEYDMPHPFLSRPKIESKKQRHETPTGVFAAGITVRRGAGSDCVAESESDGTDHNRLNRNWGKHQHRAC